jgi:hypothetical protein
VKLDELFLKGVVQPLATKIMIFGELHNLNLILELQDDVYTYTFYKYIYITSFSGSLPPQTQLFDLLQLQFSQPRPFQNGVQRRRHNFRLDFTTQAPGLKSGFLGRLGPAKASQMDRYPSTPLDVLSLNK